MHRVHVPQQPNDYDCGVYALSFMERLVELQPELSKPRPGLSAFDWLITPQNAAEKRAEYDACMCSLWQLAIEREAAQAS